MNKTFFLSVWHNWGGWDTWAQWNQTNEATEANFIVNAIIKKWIPGVNFIKVPLSLTLVKRIAWINKNLKWKSEPFALEFHLDSAIATAWWSSVWYNDDNSFTQWEWKQFLMEYTRITWISSRHVNSDTTNRHKNLWFVSDVKCASLLIELWFISNKNELQIIRNKAVDWAIAWIKNMIKN